MTDQKTLRDATHTTEVEPYVFHFNVNGAKPLILINSNGEVRLGEGISPEEGIYLLAKHITANLPHAAASGTETLVDIVNQLVALADREALLQPTINWDAKESDELLELVEVARKALGKPHDR